MKRINSANLKTGKQYKMVHSRKGTAIVECIEPYDDGGKFKVVEGELRGINDYYGPGDEVSTVNNLAKFYEVSGD